MDIYFMASPVPRAQEAFPKFIERYGQTKSPAEADIIVSLGGDGQTLQALVSGIKYKKPVFGLNFGHVGHLQNRYKEDDDFENLIERICAAETMKFSPLRIKAEFANGDIKTDFAINEFQVCTDNPGGSIFLRVFIDGIERVSKLSGDGLIIATTVGSTALSESAGGPILPLGDDLLAFTPKDARRGLIRPTVIRPRPICVEVIDSQFRKARVLADSRTLGTTALKIDIRLDTRNKYRLLFDRGYSLPEKVMRTQFLEPYIV